MGKNKLEPSSPDSGYSAFGINNSAHASIFMFLQIISLHSFVRPNGIFNLLITSKQISVDSSYPYTKE